MITKCPDCGGVLEEGAMMDFTYGGTVIQRHAKTKVPTITKVTNFMSETTFEDIRRVITYRCTKCNRLFPYAQDILLGKTLWQANRMSLSYGIMIGAVLVAFVLLLVFGLLGVR